MNSPLGVVDEKLSEKGFVVPGFIQHSAVIFQEGSKVADIQFWYEAKVRDKNLDNLFLTIVSTFKFIE